MQCRSLCASVLASLLALQSVAYADEPTASAPETPAQHWYGWQPLIADASSLTTLVAVSTLDGSSVRTPLQVASALGFVLGPPIIHIVHGHNDKALGSLLLRTLLPAAGFFGGALIGGALTPSPASGSWGRLGDALAGALIGGFAGLGTAIVVDDAFLAREREAYHPPPTAPSPPPEARYRPTFEPRISSIPGGATLGVGGTF